MLKIICFIMFFGSEKLKMLKTIGFTMFCEFDVNLKMKVRGHRKAPERPQMRLPEDQNRANSWCLKFIIKTWVF